MSEAPADADGVMALPARAVRWIGLGVASPVIFLVESLVHRLAGNTARRDTNPFLVQGNYAPVQDEVFDTELVVKGTLPPELAGIFARIGPNPALRPMGDYHWFDGDGMVHACRIKNGRAEYSNRWVQTSRLQQEKKLGWAAYLKIGDLKGVSGLLFLALAEIKRMFGLVRGKGEGKGVGSANTALVFHANQLLALHEQDLPYALRIVCEGIIETCGRVTYGLQLDDHITAHPKVDPKTDELHFFGYSLDKKPFLTYSVADANGNLLKSTPINLPEPVMMHDFAVTANYAVFLDCPLVFNPQTMVKKGTLPFEYNKARGARIGLQRRSTTTEDVQWFQLPSFMAFHVASAWEDGAYVHIYLCCMEEFDLNNFIGGDLPLLHHIVLNTETGAASRMCMSETAMDFPKINDMRAGHKHRYTYGAIVEASTDLSAASNCVGIAKMDLQATGIAAGSDSLIGRIDYGAKRFGGEAVFVARSQGFTSNSEDDGWLLTFVHDEINKTNELLIFDAKTMAGEPLASVQIPHRIPYGFHATFVSEQQLKL